MLPQLSNYLLKRWDEFFPGIEKPKRIGYLGISGSVEGGTTTFLAFLNENKRPSFIVRILRNLKKEEQFSKEKEVLLYLDTFGSFIKNSVPKLILCEKISSRQVLVESFLEGKPMNVTMQKNGLPKTEETRGNLKLISEWLIRFNEKTKETILDASKFKKEIREKIEEFQTIFQLPEKERKFLREVVRKIENLKNINLFLYHGDFCRQNILVLDSKINVIDWISAKNGFLPFYDFFFFLTTYFLQKRKGLGLQSYLQAFENTLFEPNPYSKLIKEFLIEYFNKFEIDTSFALYLFTLFLIEKAVSEYREILNLSEEGFIPRFPIYLGLKKNYNEGLKEQTWIYFFHFLVKNQKSFIIPYV